MKPPASFDRDWRQFQLLSRDSVRRLLDTAVASRDADPMQYALWGLALAMTPPVLFAVRKILDYPFLLHAPAVVVQRVALADRLFFITYGMLSTALLAALTWDALFPDRTDQEIVGVLPVRPRTLAAARLGAATTVAVTFAVAISLPSGLIYSAASAVHPLIGWFPRVLLGHLVATTCACLFVFFTLMSVRGLVAVCAGERAAQRLAVLLQLVTVVLLIEVFLFLPSVLPALVDELQQGGPSYALPPVWFGALYASIAEGGPVALIGPARPAVLATVASAVIIVGIALVPAAWMGRRLLETRGGDRAHRLTAVAGVLATTFIRRPVVRAIFLFAAASLARSRRHKLILSTYLGLAIATAVLGLMSATLRGSFSVIEPAPYLLAVPLVFTFFVVFGLRASFAVPTEIDANWSFRLSQPTVRESVAASRLLILLVGVMPIAAASLLTALTLWPASIAIRLALCDLVSGAMLLEAALFRWTKVPFASSHTPATDTLKSQWPWYLLLLHLYAFQLARLQHVALRSMTGAALYVLSGAVVIAALRLWRAWRRPQQMPTFEEPEHRIEGLNLSEALY